ncbi:MAG: hypothetical protein ACLRMX_02185 [Lachnospira eligens]
MGNRAPIYSLAILGMSVSYAMFSVMGSLLMKNIVDMAAALGQNNLKNSYYYSSSWLDILTYLCLLYNNI